MSAQLHGPASRRYRSIVHLIHKNEYALCEIAYKKSFAGILLQTIFRLVLIASNIFLFFYPQLFYYTDKSPFIYDI